MATKEGVEGASYEPPELPEFSTASDQPSAWKGDLLALLVHKEDLTVADNEDKTVSVAERTPLADLDKQLDGIVAEMLEAGDFKGEKGTSCTARLRGNARHVSLLGLGKQAQAGKAMSVQGQAWGTTPGKAAGVALAAACKGCKAKSAAVAFLGSQGGDSISAQDIAFGVCAAPGESTRFKSEGKPPPLATIALLDSTAAFGTSGAGSVDAALGRGVAYARATLYARYLVESPPNVCSPAYLAGAARAVAERDSERWKISVLEREECEKMGMGCYLGVADGSDAPPKFIHLTYSPPGAQGAPKLAFVGKGVTFDTGGYNIKAGPGSLIEKMKFDMGGSAAVFGAARAIAELKPENVEIHFISAACENMINGRAYRPGDVLVSASGKTVEIGNTDAEGRLTLCDALWYAQEKVGAQKCIDIATLTGAQLVALGTSIGAVMAPEDTSVDAVRAAGGAVGEKWWQLPLDDEYFEMMKSKCADMNNIGGGRFAGSITAGLFLKQFVDAEKMEWAHCDMAGPVWDHTANHATGFGAATLAAWAVAQAEAGK